MMPTLDDNDPNASLLVRTDFGNERAWLEVVAAACAAYGPDQFSAGFVPVSEESFAGLSPAELATVPGSALVVFGADAASMSATEKTLVVVDRNREPGRSFRVTLSEAWGPENNLRLANMDFVEFADSVDADGVFRGFKS